MIKFVVFCCFDPELHQGNPADLERYRAEEIPRDRDLIPTLSKSIETFYPGSQLNVITNRPKAFTGMVGLNVIERQVDFKALMFERTLAYRDFLRELDGDNETLVAFIDSDTFLAAPLSELEQADFDIALTTHRAGFGDNAAVDDLGLLREPKIKVSPINGGVVFSRNTPEALGFWNQVIDAYEKLAALGDTLFEGRAHLVITRPITPIKKWAGDQFALMHLCGPSLIPALPEQADVAGATVRYLDIQQYNYTPDIEGSDIRWAEGIHYFVHCKGPRKAAMAFLAQHLGIL